MKIVKTILCTLFGLMFMNAGLDKFFHYMPVPPLEPEMMKIGEAFMTISWLMPLVGFIELLGGLLFIIPNNATYFNLMPAGLAIAGVFFLINIWVIYDNREKYKSIICD